MDEFFDSVVHGTLSPEEVRILPEPVAYWTGQIRKAADRVKPGRSVCDYQPWKDALRSLRLEPVPPETTARLQWGNRSSSDLMAFAYDVSRGLKKAPRPDLVDFALTFLEADVMLFQSGYLKRDLILRLRQLDLEGPEILRIKALLMRAVLEGAGLEEFVAYTRLSAKLAFSDALDGWEDWLQDTAKGAILTYGNFDSDHLAKVLEMAEAQGIRFYKLFSPIWWKRPALGLQWPEMNQLVPAGEPLNTPEQQVKRNAWHMLDAIHRRRASQGE